MTRKKKTFRENPHVSVVVDRYEENWTRLAYVIIAGKARALSRGEAHQRAVRDLRKKYHPYRSMAIHERPIIQITPIHCKSWGALEPGPGVGIRESEHPMAQREEQ